MRTAKRSILLCAVTLLVGTLLGFVPAAHASEVPRAPGDPLPGGVAAVAGLAERTGVTQLIVTGSAYLDVTMDSDVPVDAGMESVPDMVTLRLGSSPGAETAHITLSGLAPLATYYLYTDTLDESQTLLTDQDGRASFDVDLAVPHVLFLQTERSTVYLTDTGWSDSSVGTWDPVTRVATLTRDLTQTVQIGADNVTLDGGGHTLTGTPSLNGVYVPNRNGVVVTNLTVRGFQRGVYCYQGTASTIASVTASGNTNSGIEAYNCSGLTIGGCTADSNRYGVNVSYLSASSLVTGNTLRENSVADLNVGAATTSGANATISGNVGSGGLPIVYLNSAATLADTTVAELVLCDADGADVSSVTVAGSASKLNNGVFLLLTDDATLTNVASSDNAWGIRAVSSNRVAIADADLRRNGRGVSLESCGSCTLDQVTADGSSDIGFYLTSTSNNAIRSSQAVGNPYCGVYTSGSIGDTVQDCVISSNGNYGLVLGGFSAGHMLNNTIQENQFWDVFLQSPDPLHLNVVAGNIGSGALPIAYYSGAVSLHDLAPVSELILADAGLSIVDGVTVRSSATKRNNGVFVYHTDNATIRNVDSSGNLEAVHLEASNGNTVSEVTCTGSSGHGVSLWAASNNTITGNTLVDGYAGVILRTQSNANVVSANTCDRNETGIGGWANGTGNVFTANALTGNQVAVQCGESGDTVATNTVVGGGILLNSAQQTTVRGNDVSGCYIGVDVSHGSSNTISGNEVHDNTTGLELYYATGDFVYGNRFLRNTQHAHLTHTASEHLNLERPIGGNYWDTWDTPDADGDGFVDVPYVLGEGTDFLPLARPVEPPSDTTAPTTAVSLDPGTPTGESGWYVTAPTVSLSATDGPDGSGVASTEYRIGGGPWMPYAGPFVAPGEGTVTVECRSADAAGNVEEPHGQTLRIDTTPPELQAAAASVAVTEGDVAVNTFTASDALGAVTLEVSAGTVSYDTGTGLWTWSLQTADGPADGRTVTVVAADGHGNATETSFALAVANASPQARVEDRVLDPAHVNTDVSLTATFTDAGPLDTHTAVWDWGDGTTSAGTVDGGVRSTTGTHAYCEAGVYLVSLTVTDKDGGSGTAVYEYYAVVYDPEAGFVTGGGWISSSAGAFLANEAVTGKATFGFVSKYHHGASVPSGNTEFQFKAAGLNFHSESYEWLVVHGSKAQYHGSGTINGGGAYGFQLTGTDGGPDKMRMKIWDAATGALVYDNQRGASDTDDPVTALGGGSIVIHRD